MSRKKDKAVAYGAKMHKAGADCALYWIARQFGVESRGIRNTGASVPEMAAALAERIRETVEKGGDRL